MIAAMMQMRLSMVASRFIILAPVSLVVSTLTGLSC